MFNTVALSNKQINWNQISQKLHISSKNERIKYHIDCVDAHSGGIFSNDFLFEEK